MILDYKFDNRQKKFTISYIKDDGGKALMEFPVSKFKSYYYTATGKYMSDTGALCDIRWTEKPHAFDILNYIYEMDDKYKKLLSSKTFPKLYTFDIETEISDEFPEPGEAKYRIQTIQITSPSLNTIILGTRDLEEGGEQKIEKDIADYLNGNDFYKSTGIPIPSFKYVKFDTEEEMLKYFLNNIVSKVAVLAGWNSIFFDWNYIYNRIKNYYPNLSMSLSSCKRTYHMKNFTTKKDEKISLPMPDHTLILDMMDVIETNDMAVLPIKESMSLDYISRESIGAHKIEYSGSLQHLFNTDYAKYIFYGAIDSILVQLIDRKFKTLNSIYLYSLYCNEKIDKCFSKIKLTEALVFKDRYQQNLKIVPEERNDVSRGRLIGAYVKKPIKGLHKFVCCNDFASLYPSTIITCNLSFENWIGAFYDMPKLKPYLGDHNFIVIGGMVYKNKGKADKPELGEFVCECLDNEKLEPYRKDPNYFVSVNGHVYKNDKEYAFKRIQANLKATRNISKYLSKDLDATVNLDAGEILRGVQVKNRTYDQRCIDAIKEMGYDIKSASDFATMSVEELTKFKEKLESEITYYTANEQAMKLMGNSMYGGCSHVSFYWYNMGLANDITGEARNLTHMMEHHIPDFWRNNWLELTDLHKSLGYEVDREKAMKLLNVVPHVTEEQDKDAYHGRSWVYAAYGDTDSLYLSYDYLLQTLKDYDKMTEDDRLNFIVRLNTEFFDKHNEEFLRDYFNKRHAISVQQFELETVNKSGIWLDIKKRYAQILLWKDGKFFPKDKLPLKTKGLEIVKAQYPTLARKIIKQATHFMLDNASDKYLVQKINIELQKMKREWEVAPIENICENVNVNNYMKYVLNDSSSIEFAPKTPFNVKSLAQYNYLRQKGHYKDTPIYGGKLKLYICANGTSKSQIGFAFMSGSYPKWADELAPVNRNTMWQKFVLDPINRITEAAGLPEINLDGSFQMALF